jgi:general secretion pathway protein D
VAISEAGTALEKGDLAGAEARLHAVLTQSPGNQKARELLRRVQERQGSAERPVLALKSSLIKPISLEFRDAPLKSVFEALARTTGINFVLDKDLNAEAKVTVFVRDTSVDEVIRLILVTNQLERKLLNENSVLIYPNVPAKIKDYQELEVRSFFLANADVKQALNLVKTVAKSRDLFMDEKLNLLVVRDSPDALRLIERLLESLDLAEPEVMLEVEILEVSRNRLTELGLRFPDQVGYGRLAEDGTVAAGVANLRNLGGLTTFVLNPALILNLRDEDGDTSLLANPRIRVKNKEKAKIHIGDKLPVFTTTSTANVGVSASVNYLDVGLKLDVEPSVYLHDEVGIRVGLEVSRVVQQIAGPQGAVAYQIGTRSAATVLRLKNGETQVLAGLINDEERASANKLPGLSRIPILGRLFSNNRDDRNKTEIVLLITPRVLRNLEPPLAATRNLKAGTEGAVGATPLRLAPSAPGSIEISGRPDATGQPLPGSDFMAPMPPVDVPAPDIPAPVAPPPVPAQSPATEAPAAPAQPLAAPQTFPPN